MRRRSSPILFAFVALETPLRDEFLCFPPEVSVVAIGDDFLLILVYRPPFRAYINTAGNANLVTTSR